MDILEYDKAEKTIKKKHLFYQKVKSKLSVLGLSVISCFMMNTESVLAVNGWQPETFKEISQLKIKVSKDNCRYGGNSNQIKSSIESYLSTNKIPIVIGNDQDSNPYIYMLINCFELGNEVVYNINLEVIQYVNLRETNIEAVTYQHPIFIGVTTPSSFSSEEQKHISNIINNFISDWKSVK